MFMFYLNLLYVFEPHVMFYLNHLLYVSEPRRSLSKHGGSHPKFVLNLVCHQIGFRNITEIVFEIVVLQIFDGCFLNQNRWPPWPGFTSRWAAGPKVATFSALWAVLGKKTLETSHGNFGNTKYKGVYHDLCYIVV